MYSLLYFIRLNIPYNLMLRYKQYIYQLNLYKYIPRYAELPSCDFEIFLFSVYPQRYYRYIAIWPYRH